jgi:hypothetical protein
LGIVGYVFYIYLVFADWSGQINAAANSFSDTVSLSACGENAGDVAANLHNLTPCFALAYFVFYIFILLFGPVIFLTILGRLPLVTKMVWEKRF